MRRKIRLLAMMLALASGAIAQTNNEQKAETKNENSPAKCQYDQLTTRFYTAKHQSTNFLVETLKVLVSGNGRITANQALKTITVRDCPADLATFEQMLARMDAPEPAPASMEFQLHLLAASAKAVEGGAIPKQLESVVAQLKNTLKYANYRYVYSALNRISNGGRVESSGVTGELFPAPASVAAVTTNPSFYQYMLHNVKFTQDATGKDSVQIEQFKFGISVPIQVGGDRNIQYKDIGLITPLSLREGEIAVVGTANISGSDEAMIVVVSVKKLK
jgi:type II secretory pathway component GspD/PulD (secretin)